MKRNKPGLRKGAPESVLEGQQCFVSFYYEENISIHHELRIYIIIFQTLSVILDLLKRGASKARRPVHETLERSTETDLLNLNKHIYIYRFPEPRPTRDLSLTQPSPLCSCAKDRFIHLLPHCSPLLPRCSPILSRCSLVLPLSHFLALSCLLSPLCPCKFKRQTSSFLQLGLILVTKEPVMARPTVHHVTSCSFPLLLSLHFHWPAATCQCTKHTIVYFLSSYLLYISVTKAFLSCYTSRLNRDSNGEEKEDCGPVL